MAIPVWTTQITVMRASNAATADRLTPLTWDTTVASHVHAVIGFPRGSEVQTGATQSDVLMQLTCDPVALKHTDRVVDETTGVTWEVVFVVARPAIVGGADLSHTEGRLRWVSGVQQ